LSPLNIPFYRLALFDLVLKGEPFLEDLESLEQAVASFIHLSFVAQWKYPQVGIKSFEMKKECSTGM
jgi:hypothetical protein